MLDNFCQETAKGCSVTECTISQVSEFIRFHYLHKRPAIVLMVLCLKFQGSSVGCAVFSSPPREANKRYGGETWELSRLFIVDSMPRNTESWFLARCVRHIKKHRPSVRFLLSYADPSVGHSGTIYKASNWVADGMTDEGRKTPRCDYVDANTGRKYGRRGNMPATASIVRVPRVPKHRFYLKIR